MKVLLCLLFSLSAVAQPLADKLNARRAEFKTKASPELQKLYEDNIEKVRQLNLPNTALKVGDELPSSPEFSAKSNGKILVVTFFRGGWCPYCVLQLKEFERLNADFIKAGAQIIAISPETVKLASKTKRDQKLSFKVVGNPDLSVAKKFGIVFKVTPEIIAAYQKNGVDLSPSNNELPIPGTFVFKNGKAIFTYLDADYRLRAEPQQILELIKQN